MGLYDFAKKQLNDALDKKMQVENDAHKFYLYISQHADEIVAACDRGCWKLIGTDEVGVESRANDIVEKLRHDDNGAYVDAGVYRIYFMYNMLEMHHRLFFLLRIHGW